MAQVTDEILADIQKRLASLEARVSQLSGGQSLNPPGVPASVDSESKTAESVRSYNYEELPHQVSRENSGDNAKFLGAVGALCFVLAASYFIKLAIDEGWLTPLRQLIGVWLFGFSLIAVGFRLRTRDSQYASLLPATGMVVLFMAAYAGHLYFQVYSEMFAIILVNIISVASVIVYRNFRESFYALAATVGTYLVPLLIGNEHADLHSLCMYYLFWGVTYSIIAVSLRSRVFVGVAAYMAIFSLAAYGFGLNHRTQQTETLYLAIFQALQFLLFTVAVAWYSIRHKEPLSKAEAWGFLPVLLLFYVTEYGLVHNLNEAAAPWYALGFGVLVYGVYLAATQLLRVSTLQSFPMVAAFLAVVTVHALYINILPDALSPWFAIVLLVGFILCRRQGVSFEDHWVAMLVLGWVLIAEYARVTFDSTPTVQTVLLNFSFAALLFFAARGDGKTPLQGAGLLSLLAGVQLLLGLKHISELLFVAANARYATSALWSLAALLLLAVAKQRNDRSVASSSLWLFAVVAVKVLFFDLSSSGPTAQIVALLVIGMLFYAGGYLYRQIGAAVESK